MTSLELLNEELILEIHESESCYYCGTTDYSDELIHGLCPNCIKELD